MTYSGKENRLSAANAKYVLIPLLLDDLLWAQRDMLKVAVASVLIPLLLDDLLWALNVTTKKQALCLNPSFAG